jgi:hypothetical protein
MGADLGAISCMNYPLLPLSAGSMPRVGAALS